MTHATDYYLEDSQEIVARLATHGYIISVEDAQSAWFQYSDSLAAGWLGLSDDDKDLIETVFHYIPRPKPLDHGSDVLAIVTRLAAIGDEISPQDAHASWSNYSEDMLEEWLPLPERDADLSGTISIYRPDPSLPRSAEDALLEACKHLVADHENAVGHNQEIVAEVLRCLYIKPPMGWASLSNRERVSLAMSEYLHASFPGQDRT